MEVFELAEFAKNSENKEDASFTPEVQEAGIEQGSLIVSRLYNTMLGEITKTMKSWNAELTKILTEGGLTPSALNNEQLYNALIKIINRTHGRNIGDVYYSQSDSSEDNPGALPLFTGELVSNASNAFPEFCAWLSSHPNLCITQAQYDTRISQYGECPFYVYNVGANTVRLPKLVNYIKCAVTGYGIMQDSAGLPNITGTAGSFTALSPYTSSGALSLTDERTITQTRTDVINQKDYVISLNASNSNSIYGHSNTVTPSHTTLWPWVTVYNVARPASEVQAAEFIGSLSSKADVDLSNISVAAKSVIAGLMAPDYTTRTAVSSPYTATAPCWVYVRIITDASYAGVSISNAQIQHPKLIFYSGAANYNANSGWLLLNTGDTITFASGGATYTVEVFAPRGVAQ